MTGITVRRVSFQFPDELDDVLPGLDPVRESWFVAFSLTMPVLEPYLIRTCRAVEDRITDPELAADVRQFIGQEAQHFQNHRRVNEMLMRQLGPTVAAELQVVLDRLDQDYRHFNHRRSTRWNLVYAEGFEAMTCALAMSMFDQAAAGGTAVGRPGSFGPWQQLWAWHAAEEIEHRTVAFGLYEHLAGGWSRRVVGSLRAQWHFHRTVDRLQRIVLRASGRPARPHVPPWLRGDVRRRWVRTFAPGYDPGALEPAPLVGTVLATVTP